MRRNPVIVLLAAVVLATGISGCERKGPAERAGEKIDDAARDVKNGVEDAAEKVEEAGKDLKDKVEDAR